MDILLPIYLHLLPQFSVVISMPVVPRAFVPERSVGYSIPLTGLGEFLITTGVLEVNPTRTITMPKKDAADRVLVSDPELTAMMQAVERQRDPDKVIFQRAILSTLINTGVRAQECLDLEVGHISPTAKTLLVAHGKGEKSRLLHPPAECLAAIAEWMLVRNEMQCEHSFLWAIDKRRRMGYEGLRQLLEEVKCMADLRDHDNIKCHAFRRAFATRLHQRGGTIKQCQAALGHSMPETTFKYLFLGESETKAMATLASLTPPEWELVKGSLALEPNPKTEAADKGKTAEFHRRRRSSRVGKVNDN